MNLHYLRALALIVAFLTLTGLPARGQPLPAQEQENLKKAYDLVGRTWSISADILKKVYDESDEIKDAIGEMSDIFSVVDVLTKVSEAKDFEAFEAIVLFVEDKLFADKFKGVSPNAASVLNWAGKARVLMQLLIDFVINPALVDNEIDQYIARREILLDPDDAVAGIRSWGNIKQQLLGEFRKQYGDLPFKEIKPSGMVLLPAWDRKFDDYVTGWFEEKYQEHKIKEFNAIARRELAARQAALEEKIVWLEYLLEKEMESTEKLSIDPSTATVRVNVSVTFTVTAVNYKGEAKVVTATALANPVFTAVTPGVHSILAQYDGKDALARITVEDEVDAPALDDQDSPPLPPENMCDTYSNTEPFWDPGREEYYCDCLPGFVWNNSYTGCVPERKKPTIDMNTLMNFMAILSGAMNNNMPGGMPPGNSTTPASQQPPVVHQSRCNDTQKAGGDAPEVHQIDLGVTSGVFKFDYQTFDVKDQIIISQGGRTIFNTGCVGESRSVQVQFSGYTTMIEVRVNPNCGGSSGTAWNFTVHCPLMY